MDRREFLKLMAVSGLVLPTGRWDMHNVLAGGLDENGLDKSDLGLVGFTRRRHVMPALVEASVKASPHTWMWTPRPYYAAQLACGVGNVTIVEGIPGKAQGLDYSAYTRRDGKLIMPNTSGFGLKLI